MSSIKKYHKPQLIKLADAMKNTLDPGIFLRDFRLRPLFRLPLL